MDPLYEGTVWVLVGILGVLLGVSVVKNKLLSMKMERLEPDDFRKRLKIKEDYIKDLEDEIDGYRHDEEELKQQAKTWEGRYHQKGQIKKLPGDKYDLTKKSDIGIVAEDVLNQIEGSLPPDIQKVIKDPGIRKRILEYANEHPDESIEYIKRFISPSRQSSESSIIPNWSEKNAI